MIFEQYLRFVQDSLKDCVTCYRGIYQYSFPALEKKQQQRQLKHELKFVFNDL